MDNFIEDCKRTESRLNGILMSEGSSRLLHAALGMSTEAGEFLDQLKKHFFYSKMLDLTNLHEELGDLLWYIAIAMDELGTDFPTEMNRVIRKLQVRFPDKFDAVHAACRDLDAERQGLERG
jgi:NTP pyrophosphatase (non-canonical NTP hydrolase)